MTWFLIERREYEWAVVANGEILSLHQTRGEAERAAALLTPEQPAEPLLRLCERRAGSETAE
jgi:hypothetical protein